MAELRIEVNEEMVRRLTAEVERLKEQLLETDRALDPKGFDRLVEKIAEAMRRLVQYKEDAKTLVAGEKVVNGEGEQLQELLKKYKGYYEQRKEIEQRYGKEREVLEKGRISENSVAVDVALSKIKAQNSAELANVDFNMLKEEVDWSWLMGNLEQVTTGTMIKAQEAMKEFLAVNRGMLDEGNQKIFDSAFDKLNVSLAKQQPTEELSKGLDDYWRSCGRVADARRELNRLEKEGNGSQQQLGEATRDLIKAQNERKESLTKMNQAIDAMGNRGKEVVKGGEALVKVLDDLGVKMPESVKGTLAGVSQVVDGLASIDVEKPFSVVTGILGMVGGVGSMLDAIKGNGQSEESNQGLKDYMSLLTSIIDKRKEYIREMVGSKAVKESEKALELVKEQIGIYQKEGKKQANDGAGIGKHSYGVRTRKSLKEYKEQFDAIGVDFGSLGGRMEGLFELSPEKLKEIKEEIPEAWAKINDRMRESLEAIVSSGEEMETLTAALSKSLTGITFDDAKNSLIGMLMDAGTTMEDVAGNFENYMRQAIVGTLVNGEMNEDIKNWYKKFAEAMKEGGLSENERKNLQEDYSNIYIKAVSMRDEAYKTVGIQDEPEEAGGGNQSPSAGGFETMSQDTGSELNGRFTALQMAGEEIKAQGAAQLQEVLRANATLDALVFTTSSARDIADEVRTIQMNAYLELKEISDNTANTVKELKGVNERLNKIDKNTANL